MTASGQNVENASGTKSLTKDTNWQLTCIFRDEFSSVLKESSLFADLTQVPESELMGMFARACSSADEASTVECDWTSQELEKRGHATERRFGVDMVHEMYE
jgi:hypothetical protein